MSRTFCKFTRGTRDGLNHPPLLSVNHRFTFQWSGDSQSYHEFGLAITTSGYWRHLKLHPGHENDNPPPPRTNSNFNRGRQNNYGLRNTHSDSNKVHSIFFNFKSSYYTNETVLK